MPPQKRPAVRANGKVRLSEGGSLRLGWEDEGAGILAAVLFCAGGGALIKWCDGGRIVVPLGLSVH